MAFDKSKAKLSSNVLDMKFMKKSKEKSEREAEEEKRKILFDSELPDCFIKGGDACVMEPSFVPCLQLLSGRFSFKGMNPEIEKLMQDRDLRDMDKLKKMDGVSDREMAERYSTLMGTMKKKFTSKRKWSNQNNNNAEDDVKVCSTMNQNSNFLKDKRPKFRKPRDN